jgi:hypothetical protein
LVSLRATGRSLDSFTGLPRLLLQSLSKRIGVNAATIQIASLKRFIPGQLRGLNTSVGARNYAGYKALGQEDQHKVTDVLAHLSKSAVSIHDLVKSAEVWLYENQYVFAG